MPSPAELAQIAERHRVESRTADRDRMLDFMRAGLECVGWCALGLFLIGCGLNATDEATGRLYFWAGVGAGNGGWLFSVLAAYRRGEKRGDW